MVKTGKTVVIDKQFENLVPAAAYPVAEDDTVSLTSYQPNELIYKYSAASEKFGYFLRFITLQDGNVLLMGQKHLISGQTMY